MQPPDSRLVAPGVSEELPLLQLESSVELLSDSDDERDEYYVLTPSVRWTVTNVLPLEEESPVSVRFPVFRVQSDEDSRVRKSTE